MTPKPALILPDGYEESELAATKDELAEYIADPRHRTRQRVFDKREAHRKSWNLDNPERQNRTHKEIAADKVAKLKLKKEI